MALGASGKSPSFSAVEVSWFLDTNSCAFIMDWSCFRPSWSIEWTVSTWSSNNCWLMKSSLQKGHFFISSSLGFALSDGLVCSMGLMSSSAIRYDDNVMLLLWHMLQEISAAVLYLYSTYYYIWRRCFLGLGFHGTPSCRRVMFWGIGVCVRLP